jgi:hypothetical protein
MIDEIERLETRRAYLDTLHDYICSLEYANKTEANNQVNREILYEFSDLIMYSIQKEVAQLDKKLFEMVMGKLNNRPKAEQ